MAARNLLREQVGMVSYRDTIGRVLCACWVRKVIWVLFAAMRDSGLPSVEEVVFPAARLRTDSGQAVLQPSQGEQGNVM